MATSSDGNASAERQRAQANCGPAIARSEPGGRVGVAPPMGELTISQSPIGSGMMDRNLFFAREGRHLML